ncbi:MAG: hypothetical protein JXR64_03285 [Spirochaetales bacterium]|nr:hypothetical protein [Spirochaetales bacterium]
MDFELYYLNNPNPNRSTYITLLRSAESIFNEFYSNKEIYLHIEAI